jgi:hypothetical protein
VQSHPEDATDFAAAAIQEAESTAITAMYLRTRRLHEHCGDIPPIDSRRPTTLNALDQPPAGLSNQRVSGLTGAVQFVEVVICWSLAAELVRTAARSPSKTSLHNPFRSISIHARASRE